MNDLPQSLEPEISLEESPDLVSGRMSELRKWAREKGVEEIECHTPDFAGIARGKVMPAEKWFGGVETRLPTSVFFSTITGSYADSPHRELWSDADMILKPDLRTASSLPWATVPSIQVIHDVLDLDGKPIDFAPRSVLRRVLRGFEKLGWKPVIAPELEFYLTKPNTDPDLPLEPPQGRSGRTQRSNQAFSMQGIDEYESVTDHIYDFAAAQGVEIDTIIQEFGPAQLEVNLVHGDAMEKADEVFIFKRTVREAALRCGCYATFMAKPIEGHAGNAMHIHQSVVDIDSGYNIFSDAKGEPTDLFRWFIGGQQKYSYATSALWAPYVNSYRRLVPDMSAPINLEWGYDNRTTGLRVPRSGPKNRRVENRLIGADTNPYIAIAGSLAAGLLGIRNKIEPREPVTGNGFAGGRALPYSLLEGIEAFAASEELADVLGQKFVDMYTALKFEEYDAFMQVISPWERQHLLLNV